MVIPNPRAWGLGPKYLLLLVLWTLKALQSPYDNLQEPLMGRVALNEPLKEPMIEPLKEPPKEPLKEPLKEPVEQPLYELLITPKIRQLGLEVSGF